MSDTELHWLSAIELPASIPDRLVWTTYRIVGEYQHHRVKAKILQLKELFIPWLCDDMYLEPIGFVFLIYAFVMFLQTIGMLIHRTSTFLHTMARLIFPCCQNMGDQSNLMSEADLEKMAKLCRLDQEDEMPHEQGSTIEELAEFVGPGWVWRPFPSGFDAQAYRTEPYSVSERVSDGQLFNLGGRTLEVLLTPGHAPDALCLIDRDNRLLFTGDTFYLAPLYTHLRGSDFRSYVETTQRLKALAESIDQLLTAHNVPLVSGDYLVALGDAFETIAAGRGDYSLADGYREYDFGDFSVIVDTDELN